MRHRMICAMIVTAIILPSGVGSTLAQSATEGPLASPDAPSPANPPPANPPPAKSLKTKVRRKATKTAHRGTPAPVDASDGPAQAPPRSAALPPGTPLPDDPVDFGMKWSGSNDSATQTRVQNYNGNAQGTGAEVGMKLHF